VSIILRIFTIVRDEIPASYRHRIFPSFEVQAFVSD